jgi:acyl carrier protein
MENSGSHKEIVDILNKIIGDIIRIKSFNILEYKDASDVPEWDSLNHVIILSEIERRFNISIPLIELQAISDFSELIKVIEGQLQ